MYRVPALSQVMVPRVAKEAAVPVPSMEADTPFPASVEVMRVPRATARTLKLFWSSTYTVVTVSGLSAVPMGVENFATPGGPSAKPDDAVTPARVVAVLLA